MVLKPVREHVTNNGQTYFVTSDTWERRALFRAVQFVKGGFSYRGKKEFGSNAEIWRRGFADHRIRDFEDYDRHVHYIHLNPVKKHLCTAQVEYKYSSAFPGWKLDPIPQGLKPHNFMSVVDGTAKAVPFQSMNISEHEVRLAPAQSNQILK